MKGTTRTKGGHEGKLFRRIPSGTGKVGSLK